MYQFDFDRKDEKGKDDSISTDNYISSWIIAFCSIDITVNMGFEDMGIFYIHNLMSDVITHPCINFKGCLTKQSLQLRLRYLIRSTALGGNDYSSMP